jgi:outer membrane protein
VLSVSKKFLAIGAAALVAVLAMPAAQAAQGDWLLKGGVTVVTPKSNNLNVGDLGDVAGLGTVTNAHVEVGDATSFGFTVTYMMTDQWGVELLAAVPFKHDIKLVADIDGMHGKAKFAETKQLPPTLSLQYHFMPGQKIEPYVGLGLNWTIFSSEKILPDVADKISLSDSFGVAAQLGADIRINDKWFANVDVRYAEIKSDVKVTDTEGVTDKIGQVKINPIIYSFMIGYRF